MKRVLQFDIRDAIERYEAETRQRVSQIRFEMGETGESIDAKRRNSVCPPTSAGRVTLTSMTPDDLAGTSGSKRETFVAPPLAVSGSKATGTRLQSMGT